jgi:hypothetical protein
MANSLHTHSLLSLPKMTQISEREQRESFEDDHSWEDVSDDDPRRPSAPPSTVGSPSNSVRRTTRSAARRRRTAKTTPRRQYTHEDTLTPPRAPRERHLTARPSPLPPAVVPGPSPFGALPSHVQSYVSDILGTVFRMLKIPISLVLVLFACICVISLASGAISGAIRTALSPICTIPIIGLACPPLDKSYPVSPPNRVPRRPDFPRLLDVESKTLESLLDETVEGPGLALEIKKAELATSDLVTLVRVSKLNSRDALADSLGEFVKDARKAGRGLTRFSSRVGGAVDKYVILCPKREVMY